MKYQNLILLFFFSWAQIILAQEKKVVITGNVLDFKHNSIANVTIQNTITGEGVSADISGHYFLHTSVPATLKVFLIGYKTVFKNVSPEQKKDTINLNIILETDSTLLQQIEITPLNQPELLKESYSLMDFEIHDGKIWLLYHNRKTDILEVYDSELHPLTYIALNHRANALNKEDLSAHYLNKIATNSLYVDNTDSVRFFDYYPDDNTIREIGITREQFYQSSYNLVAYHYPYYYRALKSFDNSEIEYIYINRLTLGYKILYSYANTSTAIHNAPILQELYGVRQFLKSPIVMNPDGSEFTARAISMARELHLEQGIIDIFCPLKIVRDSIYVFNLDNDSIIAFNLENEKARQFSLSFHIHGLKIKDQDIVANDEGTACYYKYVFNNEVYIDKINLNTGNIESAQKLKNPFPQKIKILGDYIYYLASDCKPNAMYNEQLFREKLRNN